MNADKQQQKALCVCPAQIKHKMGKKSMRKGNCCEHVNSNKGKAWPGKEKEL